MSQNPNTAIAIVGIDIGKNSFHMLALISAVRSCCGRSGRTLIAAADRFRTRSVESEGDDEVPHVRI